MKKDQVFIIVVFWDSIHKFPSPSLWRSQVPTITETPESTVDWQYRQPTQPDLTLSLNDLDDGPCQVLRYSTLTGITGAPLDVTVSSGTLILPLPELQTDLALKVIAQEK